MKNKSLLFLGVGSKLNHDILELLVNSNESISTVIIVNSFGKTNFKFKRKIDLIDLDFYKINNGNYPELSIEFTPIDSEIIDILCKELLTILKMMDRLNGYKYFQFQERINLLFKHLRFWYTIINHYEVDLLIATDMPHEPQDYIAYVIAKKLRIKKCFLVQSQIPQFYQIIDDIEINDFRMNDFNLDEFSGDKIQNELIRKYFFSQKNINYSPFYMKEERMTLVQKAYNILKKIKSFFENIKLNKLYRFQNLINYLYLRENYGNNATKKLKKKSLEKSQNADLNKKYIYIPLHYQPERTTSPQGGFFTFQELMIEMISSAIPDDIFLYVKEHPKQTINGRYLDFYDRLTNFKNVIIVNNNYKSLELIQKSLCVATVTGTAGWEAVCFEKPVLLFGHIFYQYAPGVFKIQSNTELKSALKKIISNSTNISQSNLYKFLNCVGKYSFHGFSDELYFSVAQISWNENLININNNICDFLSND